MMLATRPAATTAALGRRNASFATPFVAERPRSVIARFKDDNKETAAEKARKDLEETLTKTGAPPPAPPAPVQTPDEFLKKAGGKPTLDVGEPKVSPLIAAFTRRREIFAGRAAMVGFGAACMWEILISSHPNIMEQIAYGLNLANWDATAATGGTILALIIFHDAFTALAPWSPTFSPANLADVSKRPQGPPNQLPGILSWKKLLGISEIGAFSKANELFNGRMAMLGFAAAIINQLRLGGYYGPGPLAQVALAFNWQPESVYAMFPMVLGAWALFWTTFAFARGKFGSIDTELEIY